MAKQRIFIAVIIGGMVGRALVCQLSQDQANDTLVSGREELDLTNQQLF
jgi:dTDP-4-dehydrorhamnose reductase